MELSNIGICRTCILPNNAKISKHWSKLRTLIAGASPTFSAQIGNTCPSKLDERKLMSVMRYFNRAKFRPIPYAEFSTIGGVAIKHKGNEQPSLHTKVKVVHLTDWTQAAPTAKTVNLWAANRLWRVQSTVYYHQGKHHFFQSTEGKTEFFCIEHFEELDRLIDFCSVPRSTAQLKVFAADDWDMFKDMIAQLFELQVLVHDGCPNITGQDYFERQKHSSQSEAEPYTLSFRHTQGCFADETLAKSLKSYVHFAQRFITSYPLPDMLKFKTKFTQRYENQWQPLASVLDPQQGLGYAELSDTDDSDIAHLLPKQKQQNSGMQFNAFLEFLLDGLVKGKPINLQDFEGEELPAAKLPNTLSVMVQPAKNGAWQLDDMGGASATALWGRFAKDGHIAQLAQQLSNLEMHSNPRVKFFDIAYQTEQHTDNINRRPQLYELELSLGGWSTHPNQLQLSDLFVNVIDNELVLYSKRHCCRVVPRMASAYNFTRSSHPLLRFLAEAQYDGIRSQFMPQLENHFPGLSYYPPVTFGNLIIQAAKWRISAKARSAPDQLLTWLKQTKVSRYVKIGHADQYLCLEWRKKGDRALLWDSLQRDQHLKYLTEWTAGGVEGLSDEEGDTYAYQLQLVMQHKNEVYVPITHFELPRVAENWTVGSDWLFVSIYVSAQNQTQVLLDLAAPLLERYAVNIDNWFYILYSDPEKHIRLRIKWRSGVEPSVKWLITAEIGAWLNTQGVTNTLIKPYVPEWQRYGVDTMPMVEHFFCLDSSHAITQMQLAEDERLQQCFSWVFGYLIYALPDVAERTSFVKNMATAFADEMGWNQSVFKEINQQFKRVDTPNEHQFPAFALLTLWDHITAQLTANKHQKLMADIIHMHLNRRIHEHARVREAQLYQYLLLYLKRAEKLGEAVLVR